MTRRAGVVELADGGVQFGATGAACKVEVWSGSAYIDLTCKVRRVAFRSGPVAPVLVMQPQPGEAVIDLLELNEPGDPYPLDPFALPGAPVVYELWQPVRISFGHNTPSVVRWYGWVTRWETDPARPELISWQCVDVFTKIADRKLSTVAIAGDGELDVARIRNVLETTGGMSPAPGWPFPTGVALYPENPGATFLTAVQRAAAAGDRVVHADGLGYVILDRPVMTNAAHPNSKWWIVGCPGSGVAPAGTIPVAGAQVAWGDEYLATTVIAGRTWPTDGSRTVSATTAPAFAYVPPASPVFNTPPTFSAIEAGEVFDVTCSIPGVAANAAQVTLQLRFTGTNVVFATLAVAATATPYTITGTYTSTQAGAGAFQLHLACTNNVFLIAGTVTITAVRRGATGPPVTASAAAPIASLYGGHDLVQTDLLLQSQAALTGWAANHVSDDPYAWRRVDAVELRPDINPAQWPMVDQVRIGDRVSTVLGDRPRWESKPWDADGWVHALEVQLDPNAVQVVVRLARVTTPPLFDVTGLDGSSRLVMVFASTHTSFATGTVLRFTNAAGANVGDHQIPFPLPSGAFTDPTAVPATAVAVTGIWAAPGWVACSAPSAAVRFR